MASGNTKHFHGHEGATAYPINCIPNEAAAGQGEVRVNTKSVSHQSFVSFDETDLGDLTGVQPFASSYERQQAFADPRYNRDEGYRREVSRRLAVS